MQNHSHAVLKRTGMAGLILLLVIMLFSLSFQLSSVAAQEPTATPSDPAWRGMNIARNAIMELEGVDLSIMKSWEFFQDDWTAPYPGRDDRAAGIDACQEAVHVADARDIYYGLTYRLTSLQGTTWEIRLSFDLETVVVCDEVTVEVAAPPPDDTTIDPNLPPPIAGSGATGSFELGGHINGLPQGAVTAMKSAGMNWVKVQLRLPEQLPAAADIINGAHANGFKVLLAIVGNKDLLGADNAGYIAEFSQQIGDIAVAGPDAIEVWNEPNIDREWPNGQVSGANYTSLLASAFNAIKSKNSSVMVISGAPAPTGFFGTAGCTAQGCNDDVFMQQMAQAGAAQYLDCVGLHYNEGIVAPNVNSGDPRGEYPTYYFSSMLNRGASPFPGKPVCFTELGYLSPEGFGSLPSTFSWAANTSLAEHASWLAGAASAAAQSGRVRLMIIWNVNFVRFDSDPMGGYAIIRPDGTCPACAQLGAVMGQ